MLSVVTFAFSLLEMKPKWFEHNEIPYYDMWVDDVLWYPLMLQGKKFDGQFTFQGLKKILSYSLIEK